MAGSVGVELRRGDFRDPLEVLIRQESRTCAGCVWVDVAFNAAYCRRGRTYGRRCCDYREGCLSGEGMSRGES